MTEPRRVPPKVNNALWKCRPIKEDLLRCRLAHIEGYRPGDCFKEDYDNQHCEPYDLELRKCYALELCGRSAEKLYERPRTISRKEVFKYNNKVMKCLSKYYDTLYNFKELYEEQGGYIDPEEHITEVKPGI